MYMYVLSVSRYKFYSIRVCFGGPEQSMVGMRLGRVLEILDRLGRVLKILDRKWHNSCWPRFKFAL